MATALETESNDLFCSIIGVNRANAAGGNGTVSAERKLVWAQDTTEAGVWTSWDVAYRDVWVVGPDGEKLAVFNVTANDLQNAENYASLLNIIRDAAKLPDSDEDGLSDVWEMSQYGDLESATAEDPLVLRNYALGTLSGSVVEIVLKDNLPHASVVLPRRLGTGGGLVYTLESSADGVQWIPMAATEVSSTQRFDGSAMEDVVFHTDVPITGSVMLIRARAGFSE